MNDSNLKHAEIGKIPRDWEVVKLGERICLEYGKGLTEAERKNGEYPVFGSNGIVGYHNDFLVRGPGIIVGRKGTIGAINWSGDNFWPIDTTYFVKVTGNDVDLRWLYYKLASLNLSKLNMATGTPGLNRDFVYTQIIPLPILPEQKKIAEILSTVDQAIEKIGEAIEKTQRLKKGLMQELFTKGVVDSKQHIGKRQFKDTEISKIPKEWGITQLIEVVDINKESIDPIKKLPNSKFLYIAIDSVENETGIIKNAKEIIGKNAPSRARRVVHYNDVLMSTVRPYLKAFTIVPEKFHNQICSTGFAVLTCKEDILPGYLFYSLFTNSIIDQCNKMMVGGQYPALNTSQVEKIKIVLPSLSEQQKIAEILSSVDKRLELLRERKERLGRVKKGLMNDLLTGRKRVRI